MIEAVIDGRVHHFDPDDEKSVVGNGGEADVFWLNNPTENLKRLAGSARLVFKYFRDDSEAHLRAADERQKKLPALPKRLTDNVAAIAKPLAFGYDRQGRIIGYVMAFVPDATPLLSFKTHAYRDKNQVTIRQLLRVLRDVWALIGSVHKYDVVIGDLNDNNFLIKKRELTAVLLDVDSLSYGEWPSTSFTDAFICPLICRPPDTTDRKTFRKTVMRLKKAGDHTELTDWYAFCVIVFQLLARLHPYLSGVHNPAPGKREFQGVARIHMRISVFDPRVKTPPEVMKTGIHWDHWPPALLEFMKRVFTEDLRCVFPIELLDPQLWIECPSCNTPHGHLICPRCGAKGVDPKPVSYSTAAPKKSSGERHALITVPQGGELRGVFHIDGAYRREDMSVVWDTSYNPQVSALVSGARTVFTVGSAFVVTHDGQSRKYKTNNLYGRTTVAANSRHYYWVNGSSLARDGRRGSTVSIGSVPFDATSVWVGETFGLAVVQTGILTEVRTFDAEEMGWTGSCYLDTEIGTVTDVTCVVGDELAWLVISSQAHDGTTTNKCYVLDRHANLRATAEARDGDGSWLGATPRAACAIGDKLLLAMADAGIVQIGIRARAATAELVMPGTARYVRDRSPLVSLCRTNTGLFLTTTSKITRIS